MRLLSPYFSARNRSRLWLLLCGFCSWLWLSACAPVGPDYQAPATTLPSSLQQLSTPLSAERRAALTAWWQQFNDPLLSELIDTAARNNPDLQIAVGKIAQARSRLKLANGKSAPQIDALTDYRRSDRSDTLSGSSGSLQTSFQSGFDISWELDLFGRLQREQEGALARVGASQERARATLLLLQAEVAQNYLSLRGYQQRRLLAEKNLSAQEETARLAQGQLEAGLGSAYNLAQANTAVANYRARLPELDKEIEAAISRLELLSGTAPGSWHGRLQKPAQLPHLTVMNFSLPSDLLRRRPDIRAAERELAAATADVGLAIAELFPKFSLSALLGLQSSALGDLLQLGSRYWTLAPAIDWTLFDGGRQQAVVKLNRALLDEARLSYEKTVLNAINEVALLQTRLMHEEEIVTALTQAVAQARQAETLANGSFKAGFATLLEVLSSERSLHQAEDQLIVARQQLTQDRIAQFKALGGGWQETQTEQNNSTDRLSGAEKP